MYRITRNLIFLIVFCFLVVSAEMNASGTLMRTASSRVLGGVAADPGEAPYMVALAAKKFRGAGIIINRFYVLTTAATIPDENFYVLLGIYDISSGEYDQRIPVDRVTKHNKDDLALVRLGYAIFFNDIVKPAVLPQRGYIHSGDVTLYGWGSNTRAYSILNKATLDIVEYSRCELIFGGPGLSRLHKGNVCSGPLSGGIAPCTGDAGSPIVQKNENGENEIVGIVSWGFIPCGGAGNPQVHMRLSAYIDWIIQSLN